MHGIGLVLLAALEADVGLAPAALLGVVVAEVAKAFRALPLSFVRTASRGASHGDDATRRRREESIETFSFGQIRFCKERLPPESVECVSMRMAGPTHAMASGIAFFHLPCDFNISSTTSRTAPSPPRAVVT